ncbi:MAG: DNA-directed RNA polymerase subunit B'', partial [Methanosarcinales archaeon]|nr:DNA-directed RNA polymerase subunit B'' [Methanosarcinales archaeon]
EGPNCGLVKNFAQMVEVSTDVFDVNGLKQTLYNLNVVHVAPHTMNLEETYDTYATELEAMEEEVEYNEGA